MSPCCFPAALSTPERTGGRSVLSSRCAIRELPFLPSTTSIKTIRTRVTPGFLSPLRSQHSTLKSSCHPNASNAAPPPLKSHVPTLRFSCPTYLLFREYCNWSGRFRLQYFTSPERCAISSSPVTSTLSPSRSSPSCLTHILLIPPPVDVALVNLHSIPLPPILISPSASLS